MTGSYKVGDIFTTRIGRGKKQRYMVMRPPVTTWPKTGDKIKISSGRECVVTWTYDDPQPPLLRHAKGSMLTHEELDRNFRDLHRRVSRLENQRQCFDWKDA